MPRIAKDSPWISLKDGASFKGKFLGWFPFTFQRSLGKGKGKEEVKSMGMQFDNDKCLNAQAYELKAIIGQNMPAFKKGALVEIKRLNTINLGKGRKLAHYSIAVNGKLLEYEKTYDTKDSSDKDVMEFFKASK